uniref:Uncharacterized protein n=1 Tax=Anguilla anguilla TaxID=7936 RepID=A0A0E9WG11_ANGAN
MIAKPKKNQRLKKIKTRIKQNVVITYGVLHVSNSFHMHRDFIFFCQMSRFLLNGERASEYAIHFTWVKKRKGKRKKLKQKA